MALSDLGPNVAILKSPSNWFLVLFATALLGFAMHVFMTKKGTT